MECLKQKIDLANQLLLKNLDVSNSHAYVAWSGGKESTVILHLIRALYNDVVPIPVLFGDSSLEHPEVYRFIKTISKQWKLNMYRQEIPGLKDLIGTSTPVNNIIPKVKEKYRQSLEHIIVEKGIDLLFWGTRWQDHNGETKVFSENKFGTRLVYPLIHFNEHDIWKYIFYFNVPYLKLYDQGYRNVNILPLMKPPTEENKRAFKKMTDILKKNQTVDSS